MTKLKSLPKIKIQVPGKERKCTKLLVKGDNGLTERNIHSVKAQ